MSAEQPIRVLVADDHPVFREGFAALLGSIPAVEVVGTASDGREAVEAARDLAPDVIVMDVQMPVSTESRRPGQCCPSVPRPGSWC
jgi:DNA-binding NarL/FixJ family response regulator